MVMTDQYPELAGMKPSEIFIEWVYVVKGFNVTKIHLKKIIALKERDDFVRALKLQYGIVPPVKDYTDETRPAKYSCLNLVTISK